MKKTLILSLALLLTLSGCGEPNRGQYEYDSSTKEYLAGSSYGELLLMTRGNSNLSKAWYEKQFGKITYSPGVINFANQNAFDECSQISLSIYPEYATSESNQYIDYLAGCLNTLGWTQEDHHLSDINNQN